MQPYRHIVCCLDFSTHSDAAFEAASHRARGDGARLTLLHVVVPGLPVVPGEPAPPRSAALDAEEVVRLKGYLTEKYVSRARDLDIRLALRRGHPSVEILSHLEESDADLVVMGSQGLSGMGLVLLGSVAERVVRRSPCSVLVVRSRKK